MPDKEFTKNEAAAMMHKNECISLRQMAKHVEECDYSAEMIIKFMRDMADEHEAQVIVVELRDSINKKPL